MAGLPVPEPKRVQVPHSKSGVQQTKLSSWGQMLSRSNKMPTVGPTGTHYPKLFKSNFRTHNSLN
jgi:hypothetical protein